MRIFFLFLLLIIGLSTTRSQIEADHAIWGSFFATNGTQSGNLLTLISKSQSNSLHFSEIGLGSMGAVGYTNGIGSARTLFLYNYSKGFGDLIELRGGNGGRFYMYPDGKLYANNLGNIGANRDMHWNETTGEIGWTSSSARYKTNISGMEEDWTKILQVSPVTYNRPNSPDHWEHGYLAEALDSIGLQPLVGYSAEGEPDYIHYDKIVLYLTEMLKMHEAIIAKQEEEIDLLKRKVNEIYSLNIGNQRTKNK